MKKVTFILSGDHIDPASRDRGYCVAMELRNYGFSVEVVDSPVLRRSEYTFLSAFDYVKRFTVNIVKKVPLFFRDQEHIYFVQRDFIAGLPGVLNNILGEFITILLLFLSKILLRRKIIFDFDDAIYLGKPLATYLLTKVADVVIVGSHKLKNYAVKLNSAVFLIPTSVNLDRYLEAKLKHKNNSKDEKITIVWIGSQSTLRYLELLIKPILILVRRYPEINIKIIGARNIAEYRTYAPNVLAALDHERIEFVNWDSNTYLSELAQSDIGIAPLSSGEGEEAKCGKKVIEYMGMGIPAVASAVGENNFIVRDGENGFLCRSAKEWIDKISLLVEDKKLREKLGSEGIKTVEYMYSLKRNVKKLAMIINWVLDM